MNNILLLTDFSEASFHAARYAALLTGQLHSERIVLYHAYEVPMPIPVSEIPVSPATIPSDITIEDGDEQRRKSLLQLRSLYEQVRGLADEKTVMEYRAEEAALALSINDIAKEVGATLVVMGITVADKLEQTLIGNETVRITDQSKYPVVIVPIQAKLEPVRRIVLACDLKDTPETTPVTDMKQLLENFQAELLVVNVDYQDQHLNASTPQNAAVLDHWLSAYRPIYYSVENRDASTGIREFAETQNASLIIAIHKTRGFFDRIFHRSATHELAYHSSIPLLILPSATP